MELVLITISFFSFPIEKSKTFISLIILYSIFVCLFVCFFPLTGIISFYFKLQLHPWAITSFHALKAFLDGTQKDLLHYRYFMWLFQSLYITFYTDIFTEINTFSSITIHSTIHLQYHKFQQVQLYIIFVTYFVLNKLIVSDQLFYMD